MPFSHRFCIIFTALEGGLYLLFLGLDTAGIYSSPIKFASVCLCLTASLLICLGPGRRWPDAHCMALIMSLTVSADVFLLLTTGAFLIGVLLFCAVQTLYAMRLRRAGAGVWLPVRILLPAAVWSLLILSGAADALSLAAAYSFTQLTLNVLLAVRSARNHRRLARSRAEAGSASLSAVATAWGLGLFWACDLCVGLHNLSSYAPDFPWPPLADAIQFAMWLFYLPSQVLLVLSVRPDSK